MNKKKPDPDITNGPPGWPAAAGISKANEALREDSIVVANASTFRHGAKLTYLQMTYLIVGFAHGASITYCAEMAGTHRDTVKDTFEEFRDRLMTSRFEPWVQSAYASSERSAEEDQAIMQQVKNALFGCHENTGCLKRYNAGRRKTRTCRACPIHHYVASFHEPAREAGAGRVGGRRPALGDATGDTEIVKEQTSALIQMADDMREFYRILGWKERSETDRGSLFEKRFRHYEIISTVVTSSTFDDQGTVTSTEDDFLSIHHLAKTLMQRLKAQPIRLA